MVKERAVLTQISGPTVSPTPQKPPVKAKRKKKRAPLCGVLPIESGKNAATGESIYVGGKATGRSDQGRNLLLASRKAAARGRILDPLLYGDIRARIRGTAPKSAPKAAPKAKRRSKPSSKKGRLVPCKVKVKSHTRMSKCRIGQGVS